MPRVLHCEQHENKLHLLINRYLKLFTCWPMKEFAFNKLNLVYSNVITKDATNSYVAEYVIFGHALGRSVEYSA